MARQLPQLAQKFLDRFSRSRDFSISFTIHAIIIVILGVVVIFPAIKPPAGDFLPSEGKFLSDQPRVELPPQNTGSSTVKAPNIDALMPPNPLKDVPIIVPMPAPTQFVLPSIAVDPPSLDKSPSIPAVVASSTLPTEIRQRLETFQNSNRRQGPRGPIFEFTAYLGRYADGDWNSTVEMQGDQIRTGSLPNLLYLMSHWSKDKVKTNYTNVRAIRLDSDEILTAKPPFIFLTGTRDFVLTEKEVANLRAYIQMGGCVWGDSSVPGERSRFDLAFRREMLRVAGGVDQKFEALPASHALFANPYFADVKGVPKGLNSYQLPVYALKMYGEVAIIYTANDYGDMWQIGLDSTGAIDLRRDAKGRFIATNPELYARREIYARNLSPKALEESYKFGMNVVMHLLTRWQDKIGTPSTL